MYSISNRQYGEVLEMLAAYIGNSSREGSLREQNRVRRARLLLRDLKKRNRI
jgi:hypothetical protein